MTPNTIAKMQINAKVIGGVSTKFILLTNPSIERCSSLLLGVLHLRGELDKCGSYWSHRSEVVCPIPTPIDMGKFR